HSLLPDARRNASAAALEIHNSCKRLRVQAGPADERAINLHLRHQAANVVGLDAAAIENAEGGGSLGRETRGGEIPEVPVRVRRNFRSGRATGADGPHW